MTTDYSVIVPACNEEQWLPLSLEALRQAMLRCPLRGEVVVVDNNSADRTAEVARERGARVVFEPVNQISRARNAGARAAKGKYLVFLDADTLVPPELLSEALRRLDAGEACGGGALVEFDGPIPPRWRRFLDFWNHLAWRRGVAAGCFVFCLRSAFDDVRGFSERVYAGEEIWLSRRLRFWGQRRDLPFQVIAEPRITTSHRKLDWAGVPLHTLGFFLLLFFPFATMWRTMCPLWYKRPKAPARAAKADDAEKAGFDRPNPSKTAPSQAAPVDTAAGGA